MLRNALLGFALLVALTGLALVLCGQPESWPLVGWGAGLFVVILIERWRYERHEHGAEQGWQSTGEQFVDPETGKLIRVTYNPDTGERRYVTVDDDT